MCLHTYRGIHAHAHTYLWPCFYTAFSRKVPPHVLVCERLSSLHRQTLNGGGRESATTRRRPRRRSGTRAARPQRAAPLPQQQGARLRLVRAPDVTHRPMSLRGFASRPGAARGGREVLLRARPGDRPGRAGGARAAGGSGRGCRRGSRLPARQLGGGVPGAVLVSSSLPSPSAAPAFSPGASPCHAFEYLTKCSREAGRQKQHLGCSPWAVHFFVVVSRLFTPILQHPVFTCRTV